MLMACYGLKWENEILSEQMKLTGRRMESPREQQIEAAVVAHVGMQYSFVVM